MDENDVNTRFFEQLDMLKKLKKGWDSYDAEPPNKWAINNARTMLKAFLKIGIEPREVTASAEGGVSITFGRTLEDYHDIEFFNTGEVVAGGMHNGNVWVWALK